MSANFIETQRVRPTQECVHCAMSIDPALIAEDGECPGCGGMFFGSQPRVVNAAPMPAPNAAPKAKVNPAAAVAHKGGGLVARLARGKMLYAGIGAGVLALAAVFVFSGKKKDAGPVMTEAERALAMTMPGARGMRDAVTAVQAGVYSIVNCADGRVLDVPQGTSGAGVVVNTYAGGTKPNQRFIFKAALDGTWRLIADHSYKALAGNGPRPVQDIPRNSATQRWRVEPAAGGMVILRCEAGGAVLTGLPGKPGAPGGEAWMKPFSGAPEQQWKLVRLGDAPADFDALDPAFTVARRTAPPATAVKKMSGKPAAHFAVLSLAKVATADSRSGMFQNQDAVDFSVHPLIFGAVEVAGVPFELPDPQTAPGGRNVVVLKGGFGHAKAAYPKRVEIPASGAKLKRLHFISGVSGWGWPWTSPNTSDQHIGALALRIFIQRRGGASEEHLLRNGVQFCDYVEKGDVPGSARITGLAAHGWHARYFSVELTDDAPVEKIAFESADMHLAPVILAVTGELNR